MNRFFTLLLACLTAVGQVPTMCRPGLVAWYPFNGNANDESQYANLGQLSELRWRTVLDYHIVPLVSTA